MEYPFIMQEKEKSLFKIILKGAKSYLEFGMGGSTIYATNFPQIKTYSIDSSIEWIAQMRTHEEIVNAEAESRLQLIYVDIGPTKGWGYPLDESHKHLFPLYSSSCFEAIPKNEIDTVLIDGRFRVACGLKTIEHCHNNNNLLIMMHDFWDRGYYHILLKYLKEVESALTLGVFRVQDGIDMKELAKDYEKYKFLPE